MLTQLPSAPEFFENAVEAVSDADLSIVIQGAVAPETVSFLHEIRSRFPKAELILSTWIGNYDADLLSAADHLVLSQDPGAAVFNFYEERIQENNFNRLLVTTRAGIAAATRPYVVKMRTDFTLQNDALFSFWNQFRRRSSEALLFSHRVVIPSVYTRLYSDLGDRMPMPFHPSDIFAFGRRDDVALMFGAAPLLTPEELGGWHHLFPNRMPYPTCQCRWAPEQALFLHAVKQHFPEVKFEDSTDLTRENISFSKQLLQNNFIVVDPTQIGLWSKKHQEIIWKANVDGNLPGIVSFDLFQQWYRDVFDPSYAIVPRRKGSDYERYLVHKGRFLWPLRQFFKRFDWFGEPFRCAYYRAKSFARRA